MDKSKKGLIFVLPALIGTFIFIIIPIFCSFALSFTEWDLLNEIKFVGLANYRSIFYDKEFLQILINTFVYAVSTTFFVVIAIVWSWIFDPNIGAVNLLFKTHLKWLFDTHLAMPVLIFVSVWKLIGYNVVLFLTGFSTINQNLYEAAKIDGAGVKETFWEITIPLLKPTTYFVTLVTAISSFQIFDLIYVMTSGGPANSTNVIVYSIYKYAFEYFDIGKSCALAYILFGIIFVLALAQKQFRNN